MGVLSNVLDILSTEVGADGTSVLTSTARHGKKSNNDQEAKKVERKTLRDAVWDSQLALANTNRIIARVSKGRALNETISGKVLARAVEEDKLARCQVNTMDAPDNRPELKTLCKGFVNIHANRIQELLDEIVALKSEIVPEASNSEGTVWQWETQN